jgi:hypothetical protein
MYCLRSKFRSGPWKKFGFTSIPYIADEPLEITGDSQLGPPGRPAAVRPKFRRARRCSRPGKGGATLGEYPEPDLRRIWRPGLRRCAGSTAPDSARRCVPASGEAGARPRQCAVGLAPRRPRERLRAICWRGASVERWLSCGGAHVAAADGSVTRSWQSGRLERKWGLRCFLDELFDLEQGGTEGKPRRAGARTTSGSAGRSNRPGVRLPRDAAQAVWTPVVSRRACPPQEVRGLGRRDLGRRTAPGGADRRYSAVRAQRGVARLKCFLVPLFEHV